MASRLFFICLIGLITVSCSVKKRVYQKGYYVDWAFNKKKSNKEIAQTKSAEKVSNPETSKINEEIETITANSEKGIKNLHLQKNKNLLLPGDTCGDQIFFKSGDIIVAKVVEVSEDKIKYKRCDNLTGPQFVVSKSTVQRIKYANGITEDVITSPNYAIHNNNRNNNNSNNNSNDNGYSGPRNIHPKAVWALVLLLLSFIPYTLGIPIIISLIQASKAIKEINANPKMWRGLILAKVIRMIDIIILGLVALALIIIIVALLGII